MRKDYERIKAELKQVRKNINYFTFEFYKKYVDAVKADDFSEIFKTDFYKKNGSCYCEFLGIAAQ